MARSHAPWTTLRPERCTRLISTSRPGRATGQRPSPNSALAGRHRTAAASTNTTDPLQRHAHPQPENNVYSQELAHGSEPSSLAGCADRATVAIRRYIMGHRFDRGDVIDMLEESAIRRIPVVVQLRDGRTFEDRVTDIGKWRDQD